MYSEELYYPIIDSISELFKIIISSLTEALKTIKDSEKGTIIITYMCMYVIACV